MSELWIPPQGDRLPDPTNPFDMAATLQQQLANIEDVTARDEEAWKMLALLDAAHRENDGLEVTVVSTLALLDSTETPGSGILCSELGVNGGLQGFSYVRLGQICGLALQIDALQVFRPDSPDDRDYALTTARTPIASVQYVESH